MPALKATVVLNVFEKLTTNDLAVVKVKKSSFGKHPLPKIVSLAPKDHVIKSGETIINCGCPNGAWASLWKGEITKVEDDRFEFNPPPASGRSGSAIFNKDGTLVLGVLIWNNQSLGRDSGTAISFKKIRDMLTEKNLLP